MDPICRHLRFTRALVPWIGLFFVLAMAGCRSPVQPAAEEPSYVWPPPPAKPRIVYEKSIAKPSDFGIRRSWWKRIGGFIVGHAGHDLVFSKPTGLCLDESGNLCVTDTGTRSLWFFDIGRKRYKRWDRIGKFSFSSPVAVAKQDGIIYVADSGIGGVVVFTESGKLRFTILDGLERPSGLRLVDQTIWVVDAARHRIEVFDLQGQHLYGFGQRGTGAGEFNYPTHLALTQDAPMSLYVTDAMNFRIQKVDPEGNPLQIIGSIGDVTGSFSRPKGVATDSAGNLYVVDALFDNIQIFDGEGRFLMHWGESGSAPGCFWLPTGIAIDARDRIWVADSYNRRIQVFQRMTDYEDY
jgi:DNA-binding beta-propeller fold protein YncE